MHEIERIFKRSREEEEEVEKKGNKQEERFYSSSRVSPLCSLQNTPSETMSASMFQGTSAQLCL
jgi:hypothetical protein